MKALRDLTYVLANLSLFLMGEHYYKKGVAHVGRADIKAKARKAIKTFTIKNVCDLAPPPMEV